MDVPKTYAELQELILERWDSLASGQQRVAELVLSDPEGTAFRTVAETARLAGVHQSSVVRFAQVFGLSGYPAIVEVCRQRLTTEAHLLNRFRATEEDSRSRSLLAASLDHDQANLLRTLGQVDQQRWDDAVEALSTCPRIHVMGLRECLAVADLMTYLLRLVRPRVHHINPVTGSLVEDLRDLHPDDVFVGISIHRYTAETVQAFHHACDLGLTTLAITDSAASPLARRAELSFFVDCEGVAVLRSVTGLISLVQTLATGVALHNEARTREQLQHDERLLDRFSVYAR